MAEKNTGIMKWVWIIGALMAFGAFQYYQITSANEKARAWEVKYAQMERARIAAEAAEAEKKKARDAERKKRAQLATTPEARYQFILDDCKASISNQLKDVTFEIGRLTERDLRNYEAILIGFGGETTFSFYMSGVDVDPDDMNRRHLESGMNTVSYVAITYPLGYKGFAQVYECRVDADGLGAREAVKRRTVELR